MSRRSPQRRGAARRPRPSRRQQRDDMQLLAVGVAAVAAISLMVMVVNWLIAHWWVLLAAALVLLLGGLGWWQHRTQRAQWQQAQARALRYGLAQLDTLTHHQFEHAIRDLMHRDGCADAVQVGGQGDLGADVKATDPYGRRWGSSSASTAETATGARPWARPSCRSSTAPAAPSTKQTSSSWSPTAASPSPAAPSPNSSASISSTATSWRSGRPAHAPCGNCWVRYPRRDDRQPARRKDCGRVL